MPKPFEKIQNLSLSKASLSRELKQMDIENLLQALDKLEFETEEWKALQENLTKNGFICPLSDHIMKFPVRLGLLGKSVYDLASITKFQKICVDDRHKYYVVDPDTNVRIYIVGSGLAFFIPADKPEYIKLQTKTSDIIFHCVIDPITQAEVSFAKVGINMKSALPVSIASDVTQKIKTYLIEVIFSKYAELKEKQLHDATELMLSNLGIRCTISDLSDNDSCNLRLNFTGDTSPEMQQSHVKQLCDLLDDEAEMYWTPDDQELRIKNMSLNSIIEKIKQDIFEMDAVEYYSEHPETTERFFGSSSSSSSAPIFPSQCPASSSPDVDEAKQDSQVSSSTLEIADIMGTQQYFLDRLAHVRELLDDSQSHVSSSQPRRFFSSSSSSSSAHISPSQCPAPSSPDVESKVEAKQDGPRPS